MMIQKKYKIAEKVIEVTSIYEEVHRYCAEYQTDEPTDFSVTITSEDIAFEKQKSDSEYAYEGLPLRNFSDSILEETAVYRKIAEKMPDYVSRLSDSRGRTRVSVYGEIRNRQIDTYKIVERIFQRPCSHGQ